MTFMHLSLDIVVVGGYIPNLFKKNFFSHNYASHGDVINRNATRLYIQYITLIKIFLQQLVDVAFHTLKHYYY